MLLKHTVCLRHWWQWWFLWLHWSWNQFQVFETWWTIIKGQGSLTKNGFRELNYDGENNIILQNQREVCWGQGQVQQKRAQCNSCQSTFIAVQQNFQPQMFNLIRRACAVSTIGTRKWGIRIMKDKCVQFPTPGCQWFYQRTCQQIHLELFRTLRAQHLQFNEHTAGNSITILKPYGCLTSLTEQRANVMFLFPSLNSRCANYC